MGCYDAYHEQEKHACGLSTLFSKEKECVVVSIGSQNLWVFEEAIYQNTSCRIEVFDCTVPGASPPAHIRGRTTLHHICIGDQDAVINGQTFLSWASITKRIGMTAAPAYVKMDIEGYEYNVLRGIMRDGILLPTQIAFELHYETQMGGLAWRDRLLPSSEMVELMQVLYANGYYLVHRKNNPYCPHCAELLVARFPV